MLNQEIYNQIKNKARGAEIVAVTKYFDEVETTKILHAGISLIGESRVQQAKKKYYYFKEKNLDVRMHMIGHLQSNKVKEAIEIFDCIQSVDGFKVLRRINDAIWPSTTKQTQEIYLQINATGEAQKYGFLEADICRAYELCLEYPNIDCTGIMCMGKYGHEETTEEAFRLCRSLCDEFWLENCSMGMSWDRELAVAEWATVLRLGSILF